MVNPLIIGLESVNQAWRAQSAMAFRLLRLFGGGDPDQTKSTPSIQDTVADIGAMEQAPVTLADTQKAAASPAISDERGSKGLKALPVLKKASRLKRRIVSNRAAAVHMKASSKVVRRSKRKAR
jgi:hypothetical protein